MNDDRKLGGLCLVHLMKKGHDFRDSNHIAVLAIDALYFLIQMTLMQSYSYVY